MKHRFVASVVVTFLSLAGSAQAGPTTKPAKPDAKTQAAYDQLKALAGQWEGKSTKGWTEILDIEVIAGGSCVMEKSKFAHSDTPESGMATMYHLDGESLLLTHYCMAKNQPRLKLTEISEDGKTITFTFLDGTNLPSRDIGHMDKVRIIFGDNDHYKSQWTFYKDGEEKWMEAITYNRIAPKATKG